MRIGSVRAGTYQCGCAHDDSLCASKMQARDKLWLQLASAEESALLCLETASTLYHEQCQRRYCHKVLDHLNMRM
jgi:hypothetical protein